MVVRAFSFCMFRILYSFCAVDLSILLKGYFTFDNRAFLILSRDYVELNSTTATRLIFAKNILFV